jgi:hypothetical protein
VEIETAIEASDHEILYWDTQYIHPREISLKRRIQEWIYGYFNRWDVYDFVVSDPLYPAACLGIFYLNLVPGIMAIRADLARTDEVCEFHLWAYLGSRYRLDQYRAYLSNKQALWLYRNIEYLRFNVGKEGVMKLLFQYITAPSGIRAYRFDLTQDDTYLIEDRKPLPIVLRSDYAIERPQTDPEARYPFEHAYDITVNKAIYNAVDLEEDIDEGYTLTRQTTLDFLPTGLVELRVEPSLKEIVANPAMIRFHHWFYLAAIDRSRIIVKLDIEGSGRLAMTDKNAAILFLYAYHKLSQGEDQAPIPDVLVDRVVPQLYPTERQLNGLVTKPLVEKGFIKEMVRDRVSLRTIATTEDLEAFSYEVSDRYFEQWLVTHIPFQAIYLSEMKDVLQRMYVPYLCTYSSHGTFWDWMQTIDLPFAEFTEYHYLQIIQSLLKDLIGIDLDRDGLSNRHKAMIAITKLLSSYGIIFVDGAATRPTMRYDYPFMENVDLAYAQTDRYRLPFSYYGQKVQTGIACAVHLPFDTLEMAPDRTATVQASLTTGLTVYAPCEVVQRHHLTMASTDIQSVSFEITED